MKRVDLFFLTVGSFIFFVTTSWLAVGVPWVFNSPDENANAIFVQQVARTGAPTWDEPLNSMLSGVVHPRSVVAVADHLVPGSFLGLPFIYGLVAAVIGLGPVRFLTPLLAIVALVLWRRVVEEIFASRRVALVSTILLMFHPAFWYWSARSMMHNVPFVAFLIFAGYMAVVQPIRKWQIANGKWQDVDLLLSGLLMGMAIFFRTFDVMWIMPIALILLVRFRSAMGGWHGVQLFAIGCALAITPLFAWNIELYGGPLTTGYNVTVGSVEPMLVAPVEVATSEVVPHSFVASLQSTAMLILRNAWQYSVSLFPWLSFGSFGGFLLLIKQKKHIGASASLTVYMLMTVVVTICLWAMYGVWNFHDNPDPTVVSLGTSYTRYWLPIFILTSPFLAFLLMELSDRLSVRLARNVLLVGLTGLVIGLNIHPVFFADDGLVSVRQNVLSFAAAREQILSHTEPTSVIITDRADKFLWPERRVVQPLRSDLTYTAMPYIVRQEPLYYFGITFPQIDLDYLNNEKLAVSGLRIDLVKTIGIESLYRISYVQR